MAKNPTFNLKTGADSLLIACREDSSVSNRGKIKYRDGFWRGPYLIRQTGNSLKGSTENIESNELKAGRTKSAPRKGTSSCEGSVDVEFSPESFDDFFEAAFRGKWTPWVSDTDSISNKDKNAFADGYFDTKCSVTGKGRKLIKLATDDGSETGDAIPLIDCPDGCVVFELNPATEDIKYSLLRKYGGQTGEDLYQEFEHCAINEMSMNVEVNSIITGSFSMMGNNNPELLDEAGETLSLDGRVTAGSTGAEYLSKIPEKACDTDQFTAREGFLYINGKQIQFANNLSFTLNNGLENSFAIFEPNAISTSPLSLDITGDLQTYLIHDGSDKLFNDAVKDETIELLFAIQNKLENPDAIYVFQVFTAKHTDASADGSGSGTFNISLPWSSFNERAMRVFRIMLPRATDVTADKVDDAPTHVYVMPNMDIGTKFDASAMTVTVSDEDGNTLSAGTPAAVVDPDSDFYGMIDIELTDAPTGTGKHIISVTTDWYGKSYTKSIEYTVA